MKAKHKMTTDKAYYLTLFKIEGHKTWRASLKEKETSFDEEVSKTPKFPKITDKKIIKISRITGEIV